MRVKSDRKCSALYDMFRDILGFSLDGAWKGGKSTIKKVRRRGPSDFFYCRLCDGFYDAGVGEIYFGQGVISIRAAVKGRIVEPCLISDGNHIVLRVF